MSGFTQKEAAKVVSIANNSGLSFENQLKSAETEMEKLCKKKRKNRPFV